MRPPKTSTCCPSARLAATPSSIARSLRTFHDDMRALRKAEAKSSSVSFGRETVTSASAAPPLMARRCLRLALPSLGSGSPPSSSTSPSSPDPRAASAALPLPASAGAAGSSSTGKGGGGCGGGGCGSAPAAADAPPSAALLSSVASLLGRRASRPCSS